MGQDATDEERRRLRAVAHPLRLRMLSLLTGAELSATEVSRELDITQANASYHLRALLGAGLIEVASEERVRGGMTVRYRHPWDREGRTGPDEDGSFLAAVVQELGRRSLMRDASAPGHVTDAEVWLPQQAWDEVLEGMRELSRTVHARAVPPRTEGAVSVDVTLVAFRMEQDRSAGPGRP
ncbi:ArsR/SmtB family transcription factor [Arsenicicoccus bolidensis]|uniref:ArsR/SmtB family transcription factor n=2 Tax=Intrasporangiaceae TaxID=85021 RepID=UPI000492CE02|nr:helix-turn-helix domain-containing protein [Arsenicicoccus bolidensis]